MMSVTRLRSISTLGFVQMAEATVDEWHSGLALGETEEEEIMLRQHHFSLIPACTVRIDRQSTQESRDRGNTGIQVSCDELLACAFLDFEHTLQPRHQPSYPY